MQCQSDTPSMMSLRVYSQVHSDAIFRKRTILTSSTTSFWCVVKRPLPFREHQPRIKRRCGPHLPCPLQTRTKSRSWSSNSQQVWSPSGNALKRSMMNSWVSRHLSKCHSSTWLVVVVSPLFLQCEQRPQWFWDWMPHSATRTCNNGTEPAGSSAMYLGHNTNSCCLERYLSHMFTLTGSLSFPSNPIIVICCPRRYSSAMLVGFPWLWSSTLQILPNQNYSGTASKRSWLPWPLIPSKYSKSNNTPSEFFELRPPFRWRSSSERKAHWLFSTDHGWKEGNGCSSLGCLSTLFYFCWSFLTQSCHTTPGCCLPRFGPVWCHP